MRYLAIILSMLISSVSAAQTPPQSMLLTQYFVHRAWDNPAAMGAEVRTSVALAGQYRLYGFENAPMNGAFQLTVPFGGGTAAATNSMGGPRSFGAYYNDGAYSRSTMYDADEDGAKPMAWGITLKAASMGVQRRYEALAAYSYQIHLNASALSFGISLGANVNSNNYASLTDEYNVDPLQNSAESAAWSFTAQTGVYWYNDDFYLSLYSPAVIKGDVFAQAGYAITISNSENDGYDSPAKKNKWDIIHLQAGRMGTGTWRIQAATIFTMKGLLGIGAAWQYPANFAALASLTIGGIQINYAYGIYGFNENLLQHEITIKIRFSGKKEVE